MSDKRNYEDKSGEAPVPRSLTALLTVTQELREAVARRQLDQVSSLVEQAESAWLKAQSENIHIYSRGGDALNCQRYADGLNAANGVMGAAFALLGPKYRRR